MRKIFKCNSGQVTIEFIFSFSFALLFLVFFLYFAFNYAIGYIAHYATYSASRAYLSHDLVTRNPKISFEEARRHASVEFSNYPLKNFGVKSKSGIRFHDPNSNRIFEYVGAYYVFIPPFASDDATGKPYDLLSESFLGKEPTKAECACQIAEQMNGVTCTGEPGLKEYENDSDDEITLYDNGC